MKKILKHFEVEYLQIMDENLKIDTELMPKIKNKTLVDMYKHMVFIRQYDEKLFNLQRQGKISTYIQVRGQEAIQTAIGFLMKKNDWLVPAFREICIQQLRDEPIEAPLLYFGGDERGSNIKANNLPIAIPVASQLSHAVGIGMAMKLKKEKKAVVTFFGDGATSQGEFHEAMNFAGVFQVPVVFVCQNNQYAISVPVSKQTHSATIAQKAIAYGIKTIKIDGNDIFSVYSAAKQALDLAKKKNQPMMIECFTYRLGEHTSADDSTRYRLKSELQEWEKKDPILRLKNYLIKNKLWNNKKEKVLIKNSIKKIEQAIKRADSIKPPELKDMFSYTYKAIPQELEEEYNELIK